MNLDTLQPSEKAKLAAAQSANEWNAVCDQVKAARGGAYPSDWWPVVVQSGFASQVRATWVD